MLRKLKLLLNTTKYLKAVQLQYQILYRLKKAAPLNTYNSRYRIDQLVIPFFSLPPFQPQMVNETGTNFCFLNIIEQFDTEIDWALQKHGALWNYNLQYANYLLQENLSIKTKKALWNSLHEWLYSGRLPLEPYPASLRIINAIRFLSANGDKDEKMLSDIHAELDFLSKRLEFHLLANHLLENYFALLMGGTLFSEKTWIIKAEKGLQKQLAEQVLVDGGHFELSPMYHQIILFRVLELSDWYSNWEGRKPDFGSFVKNIAEKMLAWLKQMSFQNGDIPHFNDSTIGIAQSTSWLIEYGKLLNIQPPNQWKLKDSGYRAFNHDNYECRVDVAPIGASYQPGHAHSDALSFILYKNGEPFFVEQGTSTYQIGERRNHERSTQSHNTVVINNNNQSQVWGGFRVAERAKIQIESETNYSITASHNGYQRWGIIHYRHFEFYPDKIIIKDKVTGPAESAVAYFHLHPSISLQAVTLQSILEFQHVDNIVYETYKMAEGYNHYKEGTRLKVHFKSQLTTVIHIKNI
ncbi:alginate lyase family protein [Niabella beijingensis]|uniref:alginate lyase family protein n=1 Tax=Niabella beijingensis TaxID=2872700 RepID=UPI001CBFEBA0|nr:alginate lyase family protein [Niabella beijingensis]MBZ4191513.1 heparinase II/III family protein [Niabella beijingensis]